MTEAFLLSNNLFTEMHWFENALESEFKSKRVHMSIRQIYIVLAWALENVRSKKGDVNRRIDCYSYMAWFGTKHVRREFFRAYGKTDFFELNFAIFWGLFG